MSEWQPIDTAPKNTNHVRLGRWERIIDIEEWCYDIAPVYEDKLQSCGFLGLSTKEVMVKTWEARRYTHWQPLPPPPT